MERRIKIIFSIFCIWFIIVAFKLWSLQVVNHDYYVELAKRNRIRVLRVPACRGRIMDRNGVVLADNKAATQLVIIADDIEDRDLVVSRISSLTGLNADYILKKIKDSIFKPFIPAVLAEDLNYETLVGVSEAKPELSGVSIMVRPVRDYLFGAAASNLVGYVGEVTQKELARGYKWDDIIGRDGIEKVYDTELQGFMGFREMQVDNKGDIDKVLKFKEPVQGDDLYLTLDSGLQKVLYNAFTGHAGAGIVMDPHSGNVLALVSVPGYPPQEFVSPADPEVISKIFNDKNKPMMNRAIQGLYPPGSVFKIIVALAGLTEGVIDENTLYHCDGKFNLGNSEFRCWGKHNWVDLNNAIKKSCNEYFYQAGLKTGMGAIANTAKEFGFGSKTGINLPGEKEGLIPDSDMEWYPGDTVNLSIGHGYILVTPVQVACMVSAVANSGRYYRPTVCIGEETEIAETGIDAGKIELVKKGMLRAVKEESGTGHRAFVSGLDIAGKTGTADLANGKTVTWFAGFAPFSNPSLVVVIVTEGGESGGHTAAPIAKEVFSEWYKRMQ